MVVALFLFLIDNLLIYWARLPGLSAFLEHLGWITGKPGKLDSGAVSAGWIHLAACIAVFCAALASCLLTRSRTVDDDARLYSGIAAYIVRGAFWAVFLVGLADMFISFLRVEGFLPHVVGDHYATQLGRSIFRGTYIHYPLIALGFVIALFSRTLGFIWLALLIVVAEFTIVLTRFVFSYEQAFMGDLVRFWYAGLFLFSSAYTLVHDGHVRVDVFYTNFPERFKALANIVGSLVLGLPLCWIILYMGTAGKGSIIISPMRSFEISQSGFGMYTKYLMSSYLLVFSISMAVQFVSFILDNITKHQAAGAAANPAEA